MRYSHNLLISFYKITQAFQVGNLYRRIYVFKQVFITFRCVYEASEDANRTRFKDSPRLLLHTPLRSKGQGYSACQSFSRAKG